MTDKYHLMNMVGVLNVTPDSFSDGGAWLEHQQALKHVTQMIKYGAGVIDIGAESTRPGAKKIAPEEEWQRLAPVIDNVMPLAGRGDVAISVDTRHAAVAAHALEKGARWINDVSAAEDAEMQAVLRSGDCDVCVMHHVTIPADPFVTLPLSCDVVAEVRRWADETLTRLDDAGIAPERVILDPGIGFGKTARQSLTLIQRAGELMRSGERWLYGHSRKSFMELFTQRPPAERDAETAALSLFLVQQGVHYVRVHDVAMTSHILRAYDACVEERSDESTGLAA